MRLKLTLDRRRAGGPADDIAVTVEPRVTIGQLASALARRDRRQPVAQDGESALRVLSPAPATLGLELTLGEAGLRSGQVIALRPDGDGAQPMVAQPKDTPTLVVLDGPDAGRRFRLRIGSNSVGRGGTNDVRLTDSLVSKHHARINITNSVQIVDLGSSNGTYVEGEPVTRVVLKADDTALLGETLIRVVSGAASLQGPVLTGPVEPFNRSPRLDVAFPGQEFSAPKPPAPPRPQRFPLVMLIAPVVLAAVIYAITRQVASVLFIALSPLMFLGNAWETRLAGRKEHRTAVENFNTLLVDMSQQMEDSAAHEASARRREHPSTMDVVNGVLTRDALLWMRRPDRPGYLELRLGLGELPSRNTVKMPPQADAIPELWKEIEELHNRFATVDDVPVVGSLRSAGCVGVAGSMHLAISTAIAVLTQLAGTHSPAELVLAAVLPSEATAEWDWMKWLPHVTSEHSPLDVDHLAATPGTCGRLVAAVEELLLKRGGEGSDDGSATARTHRGAGQGGDELPTVVLLVMDGAPVERSRLVDVAERGPNLGVHLLWVAPLVQRLPAACRVFVEHQPAARTTVGDLTARNRVVLSEVEGLASVTAMEVARSLAPVLDAGARVNYVADLPRDAALLTLVGTDASSSAESVLDRWRTSNSLPTTADSPGRRRRQENSLRATVGATVDEALVLDLREQGPHALVGGTTGSGKSEFLQSWVAAMSLAHSPARVNFLFVDYKGGAAFSECVHLPHAVGLVTDLNEHLVRRVLTSLHAELRLREEILLGKKAKDLLELERRGDPEAPPSLVIVVDEFAALVKEVPDFVDGMVDVAQRGRSLGLHLILATQRPAGVIKENLRANTNLRIALRMADAEDSTDVVGEPLAATFDPSLPGRALAKKGPGRLTAFQSAYVGGWTSDEPPTPEIQIEDLRFGPGPVWEVPEDEEDEELPVRRQAGPNDLSRIVTTISKANELAQLPAPRRPWLDMLADVYEVEALPQQPGGDMVFGLLDDPHHQRQVPLVFSPDRDGNMAVFGTGGSGKSAVLRTFAVVAGLPEREDTTHVYGLDFGARGLHMIGCLPHVGAVIPGGDDERVRRLLRYLRTTVDERAVRYSRVNTGSIIEYRRASGQAHEPRILVLVDAVGAFRQAYEAADRFPWFEQFQGIAADGRQVGVHVIVSADRSAAVPTALSSVIQRRLCLRMATKMEYTLLSVPTDVLDATSPPGRGLLGDWDVQVAVLGGTANVATQAAATEALAERLRALGTPLVPPVPIERLPERVRLSELPVQVERRPALGIEGEDLRPFGFTAEGVLLVVGPPQSGRSTTLATLALSLRRAQPAARFVRFGAGPSPLAAIARVAKSADTVEQSAALAKELSSTLSSGREEPFVVLIENLPDFLNTPADLPLQELIRHCRATGALVAAEAETSVMMSSLPLLQAVKSGRHGIALQPDQLDGDSVFRTSFPRLRRADFPPGRGLYVRGGKTRTIQCALPDVEGY